MDWTKEATSASERVVFLRIAPWMFKAVAWLPSILNLEWSSRQKGRGEKADRALKRGGTFSSAAFGFCWAAPVLGEFGWWGGNFVSPLFSIYGGFSFVLFRFISIKNLSPA
jgi:hypothetical protein